MQKEHLLDFGLLELEGALIAAGEKKFRAAQLLQWIYQHFQPDFKKMSNLPPSLRESLEQKYTVNQLEMVQQQFSSDGTTKWMLKTWDGNFIECVLIPEENRNTVCLSSQVGCGMGCEFCSTAKMGYKRNLTRGEILDQFYLIQLHLNKKELGKITNVVFMGMGEPMQNIQNVGAACDILCSVQGFGLSRKKITVSTSGLVPGILEWANNFPQYKLAISLNAPNNEIRQKLMPVNKAFPIDKLLEAAKEYGKITGERITFEYILISGLTSGIKAAKELRALVSGLNCKVNLIPFNGGAQSQFAPPSEAEVKEFEEIISAGGFPVMIRKPRGRDIAAACGQLVQLEKKVA